MSRRLVLWRHGRTEWNATGRVQGQTDVELDEVGRGQAAEAAPRVAAYEPVRIVASDLSRARDTAAEAASLIGLRVETDERLRELDFGVREGRTTAEALDAYPVEIGAWLSADGPVPGAESYADGGARVAAVLREVADGLGPDDTALVVGHGSAIRVGTCAFLDLPDEVWRSLAGLGNCRICVLEEGRYGWRIERWNSRD